MSAGASFAVLEGEVTSGEKFDPALNAEVMLANLSDVFKGLVIGADEKLGRPEITAK